MTNDELRALADAQAAEIAQLSAALRTCMWALRQPIDGWKGECERKALDEARDALRICDDSRGTVPAHYARSSGPKIALYTHPAPAAPQAGQPIDLDAVAMQQMRQAAAESTWMPSEYTSNDWIADVCRWLRDGPPAAAPQAEPCIGNDSACPCQDGDACHYKDAADGTKAWPAPQAEPKRDPLHGLAPTHRCPACGAFWRQCDDASWNLRSASCCGLCDAGRVELVCWLDEPKREPNPDEVICPACTHQFRAIPENVQKQLWAKREPLSDEQIEIPDYLRLQIACTAAAHDVLVERRRQIEVEGWTPEHDDEHDTGALALAAAAYALDAGDKSHPCSQGARGGEVPPFWPWMHRSGRHREARWWKPSTPRRNLVKAGALILAEIERLDRMGGSDAE